MKKVLRRISERNQVTLPARVLKEHGIAGGDYVEVTTSDGDIVLKPARVSEGGLSQEDWDLLEKMAGRQARKGQFSEYKTASGARSHLKKLR